MAKNAKIADKLRKYGQKSMFSQLIGVFWGIKANFVP